VVQVKVAVARKADALIEVGAEGGERLRLHRVPLEAFCTMYSFCVVLAGYEGEKWTVLTTKAAEDEVLSLRNANGFTVLHWAAQDKLRAKLAGVIAARDAGLVNAKDDGGETPLHVAARYGCEAMARVLLAAGADTEAQDKSRRTPLHVAARSGAAGTEATARVLLAAGADKNAKAVFGNTPLYYAQCEGHAALVALLF